MHPVDKYEIGIPRNWDIKKQDDISLHVLGPKYDKYYRTDESVLINIQPVIDTNLDSTYKAYIKFLRAGSIVNEIGDEIVNGRKYKTYYKIHSSVSGNFKTLEYLTIRGNKLFTASFIAFEENFDKLEPLFKKIAATIKY